jgi:hypothetical protein
MSMKGVGVIAKMQFVLKGFRQAAGVRTFEFEGVDTDKSRSVYTVTADLALSRRYGIALQDLPLLCKGVLECRDETGAIHTFAYTEAAMSTYASERTARLEAQRKKAPRRPTAAQTGTAWRGPAR